MYNLIDFTLSNSFSVWDTFGSHSQTTVAKLLFSWHLFAVNSFEIFNSEFQNISTEQEKACYRPYY